MHDRTRRSPARFLAPLALVGVVLLFFVVVSGSDTGAGRDGAGNTPRESQRSETRSNEPVGESTAETTTTRRPGRRTYTIKTGDTLGAISEQTGVALERLQELNPDLDPQAMVAGQRIKLRE